MSTQNPADKDVTPSNALQNAATVRSPSGTDQELTHDELARIVGGGLSHTVAPFVSVKSTRPGPAQ